MAKTFLGIDIGRDQLKLALVKQNRVIKTVSAAMPVNLLREGRIVSIESMSELLRKTMKEGGIHASQACIVIPNEAVFIKNIEMPLMTVEQLSYNLPFEFNDYISGDIKDYVFDYAMLSTPEGQEEADQKNPGLDTVWPEAKEREENENEAEPETMELMGVAALRSVVEDAQLILQQAGLRMAVAAPAISAFISLIRAQKETLSQIAEEYGILDLGFEAVRMYMFRGDRHVATRVLEIGLSNLDRVISDIYSVDVHLAHTYLMSNYENCQARAECLAAYENIAVELMRALNFYRFSNRDSTLADLWLCGGGAVISSLSETIGEMLDINLHRAEDLVPEGEKLAECNTFVQAIGIAMG
ncbi:MAG: pilus assembly protein PilM [Blautia sp.]|nr:pilus assembly protein PilM [Blautia sp.]